MSTHVYGPSCEGCNAKLLTAHPYLQNWFTSVVKPKWPETHISWAWRGQDDQEQAFNDGKSREHWPTSKHNYEQAGAPCSLALDLFNLDADNQATWPPGLYVIINQNNLTLGLPVVWGGSWKTFKDADHFELVASVS
jgi:hypothetical protein